LKCCGSSSNSINKCMAILLGNYRRGKSDKVITALLHTRFKTQFSKGHNSTKEWKSVNASLPPRKGMASDLLFKIG
jgi:hypothetical protein